MVKTSCSKAPIAFPGEIVFIPGDQPRLIISSQQEGYLYIVDEGLQPKNGLSAYNVLFPNLQQATAGATSFKPIAEKDDHQTNLKGGKDVVLLFPVRLAHT